MNTTRNPLPLDANLWRGERMKRGYRHDPVRSRNMSATVPTPEGHVWGFIQEKGFLPGIGLAWAVCGDRVMYDIERRLYNRPDTPECPGCAAWLEAHKKTKK